MSSDFWFVDREGNQRGPVEKDEIISLLNDGTITRESQLWADGMDEWRAAGQVEAFASLFKPSPPPLPPTSEATGKGNNNDEKPSFFEKHFSPIGNTETALKYAKEGAIAGLMLGAMELLGFALVYFGTDPVTGKKHASDADFYDHLTGTIIIVPIILLLCWRLKIGRGYVSGALLFCLFAFEITSKIANGTTNIGWVFLYLFIGAGLINGIRGCWYFTRANKSAAKKT